MLRGEDANNNLMAFGLTQPALEPTINHTRGKNANRYTTDAAVMNMAAIIRDNLCCSNVKLPPCVLGTSSSKVGCSMIGKWLPSIIRIFSLFHIMGFLYTFVYRTIHTK